MSKEITSSELQPPFVALLSPPIAGDDTPCCWCCERPLPAGFCGAAIHVFGQPCLCFTCGPECQAEVLIEAEAARKPSRPVPGPELRRLLDDPIENFSAFMEGERQAWGVLLKPYHIRTEPKQWQATTISY